jgi:transposase
MKKYTQQFKQETLELAKQLGSVAEAARQLGIKDGVLYNWKAKSNFKIEKKSEKSATTPESEEILRLKKENEELKKVNYILKRASAFFAQDHLK